MKIKFIYIFFLLVSLSLRAEQQDLRIPVEIEVDSYLHLILESFAEEIKPDGSSLGSSQISSGSLDLGDYFSEKKQNLSAYSTNKKTNTSVSIICNSVPYKLQLQLKDVEGKLSIFKLLNKTNEPALSFMMEVNEKTVKSSNFFKLAGTWYNFSEYGIQLLYDSHGEVISDFFEVTLAIRDLEKAYGGNYGGRIIWTLVPAI